ncbi:LysE family translocator [Sphingoaurantiacus capsulatus]|uniref:LysE family translocator n=1 Tax=Sphingoaurantiacus capsulatus TaxID=1771310 RepID=A0ABV7XGC4_9SPHN
MPDLAGFLAFALASLALNIVPGADMTFVATSAARGGVRVGLAAALGIAAGCFVHIAAAVIGLSALIAASAEAFAVLKWLGAAYLLYMAWGLFRAPAFAEATAAPALTAAQAFRSATLVNVLNPKVGLFFLAFLPQFIYAGSGDASFAILWLGLSFNLSGTVVNAIVALAAARAAASFRDRPSLVRAARWLAGTAMAGLALQLAFSKR